jgi:excisionase family DNA binding protein
MHQTSEHKEVVTTGEAARRLGGVSATTVRNMCEHGELEGAYKVGTWWRIPVSAIEKVKGHGSR